jgi:hypothetical protein
MRAVLKTRERVERPKHVIHERKKNGRQTKPGEHVANLYYLTAANIMVTYIRICTRDDRARTTATAVLRATAGVAVTAGMSHFFLKWSLLLLLLLRVLLKSRIFFPLACRISRLIDGATVFLVVECMVRSRGCALGGGGGEVSAPA